MKKSIQILAKITMFILVLLLFKSCTKIEDKYRHRIIGEWMFYATSRDGPGWFIQPNPRNLRIAFKKDGTYTRLNDEEIQCSGKYEIQDNSISFHPIDCSFPPDMDVTETIYKLTADSLIISNYGGYLSYLLKEKYYRIR